MIEAFNWILQWNENGLFFINVTLNGNILAGSNHWLFDLFGKNYKSEIKLSYYQNWTKWFLACRTQINFVVVWNYTSIEAIKMSCFESVFDWLPKMKYPIKQVKRKEMKTKPKNSRNQRGRSRVLELTDSIKEIKYVWMF